MCARKTKQVEGPFLSSYILSHYAKFPVMYDQGLGAIPDEYLRKYGTAKAIAMYDPTRMHVDAIVLLPRYFLLIEAKVWEVMMGLGKLPIYKSLVPITPELKQYQPREILMELVVARTNDNLEWSAKDNGVKVVLFSTPGAEVAIRDRENYQLPEYRAKREQILKTRESLGLE